MIPMVLEKVDSISIPILGKEGEFVTVLCKEGEMFKIDKKNLWCTMRSNICFDEAWRGVDETSTCQIVYVYEIFCNVSFVKYFLISFVELNEFDDIYSCVCLPWNKFNLIKFYKDYLMTFQDN